MTSSPDLSVDTVAQAERIPVRRYAVLTGVLLLVSMICGGFGEAYAPGHIIVPADALATARNLAAHSALYRLGLAGYLIEAVCDISLSLLFYVLLKPVQPHLALLSAFFGLVSTALFGAGEIFYLAPSVILSGASYLEVIPPSERPALALASFRLFIKIGGAFSGLYGIATGIRAYLIYRSGYLPRLIGALLGLSAASFLVQNAAVLLDAHPGSTLLLAPVAAAGLALTYWMLFRGVDERRFSASIARRHVTM
ncbi:MAG TPA: DUF4386 domain-containing protein [Gemmatimonadaceae bacterium]